jgi:hypothetical protein
MPRVSLFLRDMGMVPKTWATRHGVPQRLKPGSFFVALCGTAEAVPFPIPASAGGL